MAFVPNVDSVLGPALTNLIQTNMLAQVVEGPLMATSQYRKDAVQDILAEHSGQTLTWNRISGLDVDLKPIDPSVSDINRAQFVSEVWTANPRPYANAMDISADALYARIGDGVVDTLRALATWCGMTDNRVARNAIFRYAQGQSIIRRAQTTSDNVLYVDSLAGFSEQYINGRPTPVSSTNPILITIVSSTTFTANVTGVTPDDPKFPNGPGTLTLSANLANNVTVNSYCYVGTTPPFIVRPNNKPSSEALSLASGAEDYPTLQSILRMKTRLVDLGVPPHPSTNTYHLHVGPEFGMLINNDTAWRQAFQTKELSPVFQAGSAFVPSLGITLIENNDSPAPGKTSPSLVGNIGVNSGQSLTMKDCGLPVRNSSGVNIRYAVMTGAAVMRETRVDLMRYKSYFPTMHQISNQVSIFSYQGAPTVAVEADGWVMLIRPPLDPLARVCTVSVAKTFDITLPTDVYSLSNTADNSPLKRAVVLQYASPI